MPHRPPLRLLPLLAALAGCATPGDKFSGNPVAETARAADATGAVAAVRAFGDLCGRMEMAEVLSRARRYGFVPIDPPRLPTGGAGAAQFLARPGGGAPALLIWAEAGPSCELGIGGVDQAALTREFDAMLRGFEQRPEVTVADVPIPPEQTGRFRLQRAALLAPRALLPAAPRTMALRLAPGGSPGIQAVMTVRVVNPAVASATPPPAPAGAALGAPKD